MAGPVRVVVGVDTSTESVAALEWALGTAVAFAGSVIVVHAVGLLRQEPLAKPPGVAEAVDWAEAATALAQSGAPWPEAFRRSLGTAIKDEEDLAHLRPRLPLFIPGLAA